jgi:hypothetical protein
MAVAVYTVPWGGPDCGMSETTDGSAVAMEIFYDSKITLKSCAPRDDKKGIIYTTTTT